MNSSSEVLARKYRPSSFDELIGQDTISQTLSLALDSNRLSHAYLFSGLRGSGKTSTARIFAKALICEKGISSKPCKTCNNCLSAIENRHIDIIEMDAASSRKIDDIRNLIEQTKYQPSIARYKIFIIDEVHMLTNEAFNALLKTLEEPPFYVKFILATTNPLKLPATILSRTQHFRFKSIASKKITEHLAHILSLENVTYSTDALEIIARSGAGSLRDSLTLLDQAIIYSKNNLDVQTITDMLGLVDPIFIKNIFDAIFTKDYAQIVLYIKELEEYEAEMVVDEFIIYLKTKMYTHDPLFSTLIIDRFFRVLSSSKHLFSINADGSFVLSLLFFKMIEALKVKEIDQMIESFKKEVPEQKAIDTQEPPMIKTQTPPKDITIDEPKKVEPSSQEVFNSLVAKIKDRNAELGDCFTNFIKYISYENDTLCWESKADESCREVLKHGYSVVKQLAREVYGFNTKIKLMPSSKPDKKIQEDKDISNNTQTQAFSMIEDIELGINASCTTSSQDNSSKEIDRDDIMKETMVKKAVEIFEAKKVTIQSKI